MRELFPELEDWLEKREKIALATVIRTWGSSPRGVGAKMALTASGKINGSVSGGCVEGAVVEAGMESLKDGRPRLLHFGVADETAWNVGLACGGQIDVFVQPLEKGFFAQARAALLAGRPYAAATVVRGPADLLGRQMLVSKEGRASGGVTPGLDPALLERVRQAQAESRSQTFSLQTGGGEDVEVFVEVVELRPALVVVGGVHTAIPLTAIARTMGFRTVVVDPRRAFGNAERFPEVDQLIQAWPEEALAQVELNESTAIAMLTHDPKIDDPALRIALRSPAFYVGALGSPVTQAKRRQRLKEDGLSEEELSRLHGPIGLKLGNSTPEELALAIMAEIMAVQHRVMP